MSRRLVSPLPAQPPLLAQPRDPAQPCQPSTHLRESPLSLAHNRRFVEILQGQRSGCRCAEYHQDETAQLHLLLLQRGAAGPGEMTTGLKRSRAFWQCGVRARCNNGRAASAQWQAACRARLWTEIGSCRQQLTCSKHLQDASTKCQFDKCAGYRGMRDRGCKGQQRANAAGVTEGTLDVAEIQHAET